MRTFESNGITFECDAESLSVWAIGSKGERYLIDPETSVCECPAYKYRKDESKRCKHGDALALVDLDTTFPEDEREAAAEKAESGIELED